MPRKKATIKKTLRLLALFGNFGFLMSAAILVGYFIGSYLDKKLGTRPWFLLILILLAIIGTFIEFFKKVSQFNKESNNVKG